MEFARPGALAPQVEIPVGVLAQLATTIYQEPEVRSTSPKTTSDPPACELVHKPMSKDLYVRRSHDARRESNGSKAVQRIAAAMNLDPTLALLKLERAARKNTSICSRWCSIASTENIGIARGQTIHHDRRHSNVSFTEKQQSNDSDFRWSGQPRGEELLSLSLYFIRFSRLPSTRPKGRAYASGWLANLLPTRY